MRISEFAKRLGVSADTIRRLQRKGVLAETRDWVKQRRFSEEDLEKARAVLYPTAEEVKEAQGDERRADALNEGERE